MKENQLSGHVAQTGPDYAQTAACVWVCKGTMESDYPTITFLQVSGLWTPSNHVQSPWTTSISCDLLICFLFSGYGELMKHQHDSLLATVFTGMRFFLIKKQDLHETQQMNDWIN